MKSNVLLLPTFKHIGVIDNSGGEIVVVRLNVSPKIYENQSPSVKELLWVSKKEAEEIRRFLDLDPLTKQLIKAFVVANNAIYFSDSSDYRTALWEVCEILQPEAFTDEFLPPQYIDYN